MLRPLLVALTLGVASIHAQPRPPAFLDDAPASVRIETPHLQAHVAGPVRVSADGRATVTVQVTPKPKMHVYAADAEGYVPFTVTLAPMAGVTAGKVTYPPPETYVFPPTGESSRVYMKPFTVIHPLVVSAQVRKKIAAGTAVDGVLSLRYQACDDTVCYRPGTGTLAFELVR
jgi:hypothetical protein